MNRFATQGKVLVQALKRRPHTYMEMMRYGVSVCPWKRIQEALRVHYPGHQIAKGRNRQGLITWRVVAGTRWTA